MLTEQMNPATQDIDRLSTLEIVTRINQEDATVSQAVKNALPQIAAAIDGMVARLKQGGRIIYIGAGTSGRLGLLDAVECVPTFGTEPETFQALIAGGQHAFALAVEGAEDSAEGGRHDLESIQLTGNDAVVGIAASGRTPYVLGAIDYASSIKALTIGLSCNSPAKLLDTVELPIAVPVGAEVIAGSTRMKAGTAQKMVLNMLSTATMTQMGKVYRNLMVDVKVTNEKLHRRACEIIMRISGIDEDTAQSLLEQSNNHVKTAIVMHHRNVDVDTATRILDEHDGYLKPILEDKA